MTQISGPRILAILIAGILGLAVTSALADTFRWKDKEGKVHYGAVVPAEYADQPYDVLNKAGLVIKHVEDTTVPMDFVPEEETKEKDPLIAEQERQRQSDRLLIQQYDSEEDINKALEQELGQLGYDSSLITKSQESTRQSIRKQISQAADQQRAGKQISAEQQKEIDQLYSRLANDDKKQLKLKQRETTIRDRYATDLERYRHIIADTEDLDQEKTDQG